MPTAGVVEGVPKILLRFEGLLAFILAVAVYQDIGLSWTLFVALFFAPDLSFLGYLGGSRTGAITYNAAHSYVGAAGLVLVGALLGTAVLGLGVIWAAHIGFDRMFGYGLKYPDAFAHTHLGLIGRGRSAVA